MELEKKYKQLVLSNVAYMELDQQLLYLKHNFDKICFSTSFSYEDQVITDLLKSQDNIEFFTLDTGRLFEQTYQAWELTIAKYKRVIKSYAPNADQLDYLIDKKGPNSFYESSDNRKECCYIRKVLPLKKALQGKQVWITGLRQEQSLNRQSLDLFEWDPVHEIIKFHPLLMWDTASVEQYIQENQVPYNVLQKQGYPSVGCSPCTRAVKPGESLRSGRWWWEDESKKECGLHLKEK